MKLLILLITTFLMGYCYSGGVTNSPINIEIITNIYNDSLSNSFTTMPLDYQQVTTPTHGNSNNSIGFTSDFYFFSKINSIQNITINKQFFKSLKLWVYPSTTQQDLTISLITSGKEIHAIPIINQINQINSVSRSSFLQANKWNEIEIDLEFFPSTDYRAIWLLQRRPTGPIYLDDISLISRPKPRNRRQLYKGGIQGFGVIIPEEKGIKIYQNVKTYKKSPYSIVYNLKKSRVFSINFQSKFEILNNEYDFVLHILSKKKLPTTGGDLIVSFIPIHPLDNIPRFNLTGSKTKSPCQVVNLPENKWIKCVVRIPKQIEFTKIQLSYSNSNLTTSYHLFLDNLYLQSPIIDSLSLNNIQPSNNLIDTFKSSNKDNSIPFNINNKNNKLIQIEKKAQTKEKEEEQQQADSGKGSILLSGDYQENLNLEVEKLQLKQKELEQEETESPNSPMPSYFSFDSIDPLFIKSVGQKLKWGPNLPDITIKSPNQRSIIKSNTLYNDDDFNSKDFISTVGKDPVKVLSIDGVTRNEFKFLNMNFSFPFNNFYLIVSIDPYEEVWISASGPNGTVTNNWTIIKNGFLIDSSNSQQQLQQPTSQLSLLQSPAVAQQQQQTEQAKDLSTPDFMKSGDAILDSINGNINPIKTKIKGDQGFYLKAGKSTDPNPPVNYIILKQNDIISALSFSMVSDRTTSSFFYGLLANPNEIINSTTATTNVIATNANATTTLSN